MLEQQISFDYSLKSYVSVHIKKFGLITRCPIVGRHLGQNFVNGKYRWDRSRYLAQVTFHLLFRSRAVILHRLLPRVVR